MPRTPLRIGALALAAFVGTQGPTVAQEGCFTRDDNARLSYRVFQIARPPLRRKAARGPIPSPSYPGSDFATQVVDANRDDPGARVYFLQWANRCIFMRDITPSPEACRNTDRPKGNGYFRMRAGPLDTQVRAAFSTYDRANGCTVLQARHALGAPADETKREAAKLGLGLFDADPDRERMAAIATPVVTGRGQPARYLVDLCVLPERVPAGGAKGIFLDYEVWDKRTPAEAKAFLRGLKDVLRRDGFELVVNTNPLPREPNGLTAESARDVLASVDGFIPTLSTGSTPGNEDIGLRPAARRQTPMDSYKEQLAVLTRDGREPLTSELKRKLFWNISLHDTALAEAREFNELVRREGYGGISIFRHYVKQGGSCERDANQLTACLTMGECAGHFKR